jgi:hypothetical protein
MPDLSAREIVINMKGTAQVSRSLASQNGCVGSHPPRPGLKRHAQDAAKDRVREANLFDNNDQPRDASGSSIGDVLRQPFSFAKL